MLNITHTPGTVHDDGEPMTPDEARHKAALLLVHADEAERQAAVHTGFRALEHAGEMMAHDSDRDQRFDA
jgi:hypothetical protein